MTHSAEKSSKSTGRRLKSMATFGSLLPTPNARDYKNPNTTLTPRIKRKLEHGWTIDLNDRIGLLSSQAAFPASPSPKLDEEKERTTTAISGRQCLKPSLFSNHDGSSLKMLRDSLLGATEWFSNKCALTWKVKVTKSNRLLYQLAPSTRRTAETGYGLLLTPNVEDAKREGSAKAWNDYKSGGRTTQARLRNQVAAMLPTPQARDWKGATGHKGMDVPKQITMLPTPNTGDLNRSRGSTEYHQRQHDKRRTRQVATVIGMSRGLKLQPAFAEWMMNFPIGWTDVERKETPETQDSKPSATP